MSFTDRAKLIALAIVHVFETSKPLGDYAALVVLDDGAGISYGINQFTHRSGSLLAVVKRYIALGGQAALPSLEHFLPQLESKSQTVINALGHNDELKIGLKKAGATPEMHQAQQQIMTEKYLQPALDACEGSHFTLPLSLAVIYDSINHGSFARIRDRVTVDRSHFTTDIDFEKAWVTAYCAERLSWLSGARGSLKNTVYRPQTFLDLIKADNWDLGLPINVRLGGGRVRIGDSLFNNSTAEPAAQPAPDSSSKIESEHLDPPAEALPETAPPPIEQPKTTQETTAGDGKIVTETTTKGDAPDVPATQVSQNGPLAKWLFSGGVLTSLATSVWAFITSNTSVVAIAVVCITVLIIVLIFRGAITDAIRMQTAADPDKKNVS